MLAEHEIGLGEADVLGPHDLVGPRLLEHAVLVDAGLVGEGVAADDRLVALHLNAGDRRDQPAGGHEPWAVDPRVGVVVILPDAQGHDDLFERAIARPLADAVDRAFDLSGAVLDAGQAIGHGQAEVVVAMHADHGLVDVRHAIHEIADHVAHVGRRGVADRVGNVDGRGPGVDRRFDHPAEEIRLGAGGVLGRELDIVAIADRPLDAGDGAADDLVLVHLQLELAMDGAGGEKDVDPRRRGLLERLPGPIDVGVVGAGEAANGRAADVRGDIADRFEIARRSDREPGLDHVDPQVPQGLGDLHFLGQIHARARRLLAVAERGVEDSDHSRFRHDDLLDR